MRRSLLDIPYSYRTLVRYARVSTNSGQGHRDGVDPSAHRQNQRKEEAVAGETFEAVAREWYDRWKATKATSHGFRASFRTIGAEVLGFRPAEVLLRLVAPIGPPLHHLAPLGQELRPSVGAAERIADGVGELVLHQVLS